MAGLFNEGDSEGRAKVRRVILIVCLTVLIGPIAAFPGGDGFIGGLRNVRGHALVQRNEKTLTAKDGFRIRLNDTLMTGPDGAMGVIFKDNTRISLGPDSKLTITKYIYQPAKEKYGFISRMVRGTAYFISGAIGKASPESVKFKTPVATIGTRGTAFLAKIVPEK